MGREAGESLSAMQFQVSDKTLFVVDYNQRRINQFSVEGEYLLTLPVRFVLV